MDGGTLDRENGSFDFTIQFGSNSTTALQYWTFQLIKNGKAAGTVNTGTNGVVTLEGIQHDDVVALKGIPLGAVWRITETNTDGYIVSWTVNGTAGGSNVAEGSIPAGGMKVVYTNTSTYVLPETGGNPISYTMAGWMLMLLSAAYLLYIHRERRKEAV